MNRDLRWFKSSYSGTEGGNCLEVALDWHKSSHSSDYTGNCVEVAPCPHTIHVRDSKLGPQSPHFSVAGAAWTAFVAHARTGA
ncbi:DUF397 domain-containing protein [Streptomyces sp. FXJ1.172]|uniref:DUF397 domain-containing protein n=1 Tax=Streptomyces sp. FXJ1.172 TaxID=710705 RepID=UPI0007D01869|nr:DUF397 domain-containing protein [Streptomyces sp. FXJ1.172]WEO95793.1 DUF397 domain-containing protein [Streptomyces sp. FXJ1.172]